MNQKLPSRPHLDHLRRQAKTLLAALASADPEAIATIRDHLPAAREMSSEQITQRQFRLADAQSAIARKSGFASWPALAHHIEQLRGLEGDWRFANLTLDGGVIPPAAVERSRLLIDGDRFRTESPEATYEGIFNINVEAEPHEIDIEFVEGPEAGNTNHGIYRLGGDRLEICLDINGKPRPAGFISAPGSGHALETLQRVSRERPESVTGGTARPREVQGPTELAAEFEYVESPTLTRLQGEWSAVRVVRDGHELPDMMVKTGCRVANQNEIKITFGGQLIIHALVRLNEGTDPIQIDYFNLAVACRGTVQYGIMKWSGEDACFLMAAAGQPRPMSFDAASLGGGLTLSQWRRKT